jgi:hypothetical protein
MDIQELIDAASKQPHLYLTRKVGSKPPKGFPRGELMCVNSDGEQCWLFDSAKILKWCRKQTG